MPLKTAKPRPVCNSRAMFERVRPRVGRGKVDGETIPKGLSRSYEYYKFSVRRLKMHSHSPRKRFTASSISLISDVFSSYIHSFSSFQSLPSQTSGESSLL